MIDEILRGAPNSAELQQKVSAEIDLAFASDLVPTLSDKALQTVEGSLRGGSGIAIYAELVKPYFGRSDLSDKALLQRVLKPVVCKESKSLYEKIEKWDSDRGEWLQVLCRRCKGMVIYPRAWAAFTHHLNHTFESTSFEALVFVCL